jgi:phosphatidylethanolamine N-methyltransferase
MRSLSPSSLWESSGTTCTSPPSPPTSFPLATFTNTPFSDSYTTALSAQPIHPLLATPLIKYSAIPLFLTGNTLVLTSMYALGVTGTYLGDYFGILMDAPVTSFPFNVSDAPMYHGSTLSFLATALWHGKPAGLLLTGLVAVCYSVARRWEDPFTEVIYKKRDEERKAGKKAL